MDPDPAEAYFLFLFSSQIFHKCLKICMFKINGKDPFSLMRIRIVDPHWKKMDPDPY